MLEASQFEHLLEQFRQAMKDRNVQAMNALWEACEGILRNFYRAETITLIQAYDEIGQPLFTTQRIITTHERLWDTFLAHFNPNHEVYKLIVNHDSTSRDISLMLQNFLDGARLANDHPQLPSIKNEKLGTFISKLVSHNRGHLKHLQTLWNDNPAIQAYFKGKKIKVLGEDANSVSVQNEIVQQLSLQDMKRYFQHAIDINFTKLVYEIWSNREFQRFYSGVSLNNGQAALSGDDHTATNHSTLSVDALLNNFRYVLRGQVSRVPIDMWRLNDQLRDHFIPEPTKKTIQNGDQVQTVYSFCNLSIEEIYENFCRLFRARCIKIVDLVWETNEALRQYILEQKLCILTSDNHCEVKELPLNELCEFFKFILSKRFHKLIEQIWNANENLRAYFSGYRLKSESQDVSISDNELIENFKKALASKNTKVIKAIGENNKLHELIVTSSVRQSDVLNPLLTNVEGENKKLTKQYLKWIVDVDLLKRKRDEIAETVSRNYNKKGNRNYAQQGNYTYKRNQLRFLKLRIEEIEKNSNHTQAPSKSTSPGELEPQTPHSSGCDSLSDKESSVHTPSTEITSEETPLNRLSLFGGLPTTRRETPLLAKREASEVEYTLSPKPFKKRRSVELDDFQNPCDSFFNTDDAHFNPDEFLEQDTGLFEDMSDAASSFTLN